MIKKALASWWVRIGVVMVIVVTVAHLYLPKVARHYVNRALSRLDGFQGHIEDIDIALIRGAYTIQGLEIYKTTQKAAEPLFAADEIDISIFWAKLFKGEIVGEIYLIRPQIHFIDSKNPGAAQSGSGQPWVEVVKDLSPVRIDRFEIHDGKVWFLNLDRNPPVRVHLENLNVTARNLGNQKHAQGVRPASLEAFATVMESGHLEVKARIDPLADPLSFAVQTRLMDFDLRTVNEIFRAYAKVDVESGIFHLVSELDAKDGRVEGYIEPFFKNLNIFEWKTDVELQKDSPLAVIWEGIVGSVTEIFRNQPHDQLATRIPLKGRLQNPNAGILETFVNILRNAFVQAFVPVLQHPAPAARETARK